MSVPDSPHPELDDLLDHVLYRRKLTDYETAGNVLARSWPTFLECYRLVVEYNFPTLRHQFDLYRNMPVLVLIMTHHASDPRDGCAVNYWCLKKNGEKHENQVVFCSHNEIQTERTRGVGGDTLVNFRGEVYKLISVSYSTLSDIAFVKKFVNVNAGRAPTVHAMVHEEIQKELKEIDLLRHLAISRH